MQVADIPLSQIAADILPRDRSHADPAALDDLIRSIKAMGLRQPIEVFGLVQNNDQPCP